MIGLLILAAALVPFLAPSPKPAPKPERPKVEVMYIRIRPVSFGAFVTDEVDTLIVEEEVGE